MTQGETLEGLQHVGARCHTFGAFGIKFALNSETGLIA